jgi:signal transduction histidine kinase
VSLNYQGPSYLPASLSQTLVTVDFNRYSQVIRNLISNALKFTPSGGKISIHVSEQSRALSNPTKFIRSDTLFSNPENVPKTFGHRDNSFACDSHAVEYLRIDISDTGSGMTKVPTYLPPLKNLLTSRVVSTGVALQRCGTIRRFLSLQFEWGGIRTLE